MKTDFWAFSSGFGSKRPIRIRMRCAFFRTKSAIWLLGLGVLAGVGLPRVARASDSAGAPDPSPSPSFVPVTVRIDQEGCLKYISPRTQFGQGVCYAAAAVQVFDAYRSCERTGKPEPLEAQTSAIQAAIDLGADRMIKRRTIEGGYSNSVMQNLLRDGGCSESAAWESVLDRRGQELDGIRQSLEEALDEHRRYERSAEWEITRRRIHHFFAPKKTPELPGEIEALQEKARAHRESLQQQAYACLVEQTAWVEQVIAPEALDAAFESSNPLLGLDEIGDGLCKKAGRTEVISRPQVRLYLTPFQKPDREMQSIQKSLDPRGDGSGVGGLPMVVGFCSKLLEEGRSRQALSLMGLLVSREASCEMHASLIVGQRTDASGRLQYLLRNTWGTQCTRSDGNGGRRPRYSLDWECEEGTPNLWVDAESLLANTYAMTTLEKR